MSFTANTIPFRTLLVLLLLGCTCAQLLPLYSYQAAQAKSSHVAKLLNTFHANSKAIPLPEPSPELKKCKNDVNEVINKKYPDSDRMIDATGKGLDDLGNFEECEAIGNGAHYCVLSFESENYTGKLHHHIQPIAAKYPVVVGACVPTSCGSKEIQAFENQTLDFLLGNTTDTTIYLSGECFKHMDWPTKAIATLIFVGGLCGLVFLGTLVDYYSSKALKNRTQVRIETPVETAVQAATVSMIRDGERMSLLPKEKKKSSCQNAIEKFLICFSASSNTSSLFSSSSSDLGALNGLRSLAMFWVIFGHTAEFLMEYADNQVYVQKTVGVQFWFQIISSAYFAVDIFFYLGGFLVGYTILAHLQSKGSINLVVVYIHRFLRILPVYGFIMIVYLNVSKYIGSGFIWKHYVEIINERCTSWWTDMLFINNFKPYHFEDQCMGWAWYLANDMQFFLIAPFLVLAFYYNKYLGTSLVLLLLSVSLSLNWWVMDHYQLNGNPSLGFDQVYMDKIYGKPYTRIAPYLVGMLFAFYFLTKGSSEQLKRWVPKYVWFILYGIGLLLFLTPVVTTHLHHKWTQTESNLYTTFSRTSVAIGVALLLQSCFVRKKSWLNRFLASSVWTPLARMTFAAYLIHPIVLFTFYMDRSRLMHYQNSFLTFYFLSTTVISYFLAYLVSILVEKPAMNLEKLLFLSHVKR